jgi:hypothetical protein
MRRSRWMLAAGMLALWTPAAANAQGFGSCFAPSVPEGTSELCESSSECPNYYQCVRGECLITTADAQARDAEIASQEEMLSRGSGPTGAALPRSPKQAKAEADRAAAQSLTSEEECDADRRCRIERLKRRNAAERRYKGLAVDHKIKEMQESWEQERLEAVNRLADPLNVDFLIQYYAPYGASVGYTFDGVFRLSAQVANMDLYASYYNTIDGVPVSFDGSIDMWIVGVEGTYLFNDGALSPYATGGFYMGSGSLDSYSYDDFGGGSSQADVKLHLLGAAAGVDLQFGFGFRFKFGGTVRYPIYAGATTNGANNEPMRAGLKAWFNDEAWLGFEGAFGWAF